MSNIILMNMKIFDVIRSSIGRCRRCRCTDFKRSNCYERQAVHSRAGAVAVNASALPWLEAFVASAWWLADVVIVDAVAAEKRTLATRRRRIDAAAAAAAEERNIEHNRSVSRSYC